MNIKIQLLRLDALCPAYATPGSAGADLYAAREYVLRPDGGAIVMPTGIAIEVPIGFEAQVRGRSGLAAKHSIGVLNAPGTIDSDYRGEVHVILINHGSSPYRIQKGDRIAQLVIAPVTRAEWIVADALDETSRGAGGLGSTGK